MTGLERMCRAVRFEATDSVPVAPLLGSHAVALADITYEAASADPAAQARALLCAVDRYRPDAVFTLMDLSAEPEALGAEVMASGARSRVVVRHLPSEVLLTGDLEKVILTARVPVFVDTVRRLRAECGDTVMVGALISGPLTAAANVVGIEALARMLRRRRDLVSALLPRLGRACARLAADHIGAGAHAVMVLEPCATSHILSPHDLETLLLPSLQRVSQQVRDAEAVSMLHVCGDCQASLPLLANSGFEVLSLDSPVDLAVARQHAGRRVAIMGNLDVRFLLPRAPAQAVRDQALTAIRDIGEGGGFILSGGCELAPDTPTENVRALVSAGRQ